ncbi:hypothetical protein K402DRAFT_173699 [Aulographum hederae CBS 113979]|uniref:Uncharacterized protein n=1 Tax=Aulographum hederae CBS 113979 TaxID=1176131 RepID=A0A6G1HE76_9PEZI|nr:hypothetical protein K402DRAFT_173699 [Aulographum hederae CBS 113979]
MKKPNSGRANDEWRQDKPNTYHEAQKVPDSTSWRGRKNSRCRPLGGLEVGKCTTPRPMCPHSFFSHMKMCAVWVCMCGCTSPHQPIRRCIAGGGGSRFFGHNTNTCIPASHLAAQVTLTIAVEARLRVLPNPHHPRAITLSYLVPCHTSRSSNSASQIQTLEDSWTGP